MVTNILSNASSLHQTELRSCLPQNTSSGEWGDVPFLLRVAVPVS